MMRGPYSGQFQSTRELSLSGVCLPSAVCVCGPLLAVLVMVLVRASSCCYLTCVVTCVAGSQSPTSPTYQNQQTPIPYDQQPQTGTLPSAAVVSAAAPPPGGTDGTQSLPRHPQHPLKSFSVPGPPPSQNSTPNTPSPPKHIGRLASGVGIQAFVVVCMRACEYACCRCVCVCMPGNSVCMRMI